MGKMKEKFLEDQEKAINDALDAFHDDDYQLKEYYASLQPEEAEFTAASQEEVQAEHDAWWNSLTDEQKQQLYFDQTEADKDYINHWVKREDIEGPNTNYGV